MSESVEKYWRFISDITSGYTEYACITSGWTTNIGDWANVDQFSTGEYVGNVGIDDEPTAGSENLVESGGVESKLSDLNREIAVSEFDNIVPPSIEGLRVGDSISSISTEILYYVPILSGQTIHFDFSFTGNFVRYGLTTQLPASGVTVSNTGVGNSSMTFLELTASSDGYAVLSFVASTLQSITYVAAKNDIGFNVNRINNYLNGIIFNSPVFGNKQLFDNTVVSIGEIVTLSVDKTYQNGEVVFYDENNNVLFYTSFGTATTKETTIPLGFNKCSTRYSPIYDSLTIRKPSPDTRIKENRISIDKIIQDTNGIVQSFNGILFNGAVVAGPTLFDSNDVSEGDTIEITVDKTYSSGEIAFYNSNDEILWEKSFISVTSRTTTIPTGFSYCKAIYSANWDSCTITCKPIDSRVKDNTDRIVELEKKQTSILKGLKIAYNGDSICESRTDPNGSTYNGGAYAKMIADLTGGTYENRAVSGGILASSAPEGTPTRKVVSDVSNMALDADLICFEGGINDYWLNVPLGSVTLSDYTGNYDTTTLSGALESIFFQAINRWVGKPIVFIIVHKVASTGTSTNSAGYTFKQAHDRMLEICNKWAIPVYDAFLESGLNSSVDAHKDAFFLNDRTHPNADGYKHYYVRQLITLFSSLIPIE